MLRVVMESASRLMSRWCMDVNVAGCRIPARAYEMLGFGGSLRDLQ